MHTHKVKINKYLEREIEKAIIDNIGSVWQGVGRRENGARNILHELYNATMSLTLTQCVQSGLPRDDMKSHVYTGSPAGQSSAIIKKIPINESFT